MSKEKEDWIQKKWRPAMAVMYITVCVFDFIIFPIGFTVVQFWEVEANNDAFRQWQPLTLMGAGLFHMAMGAVLGVSAWSRGQEKIAGVANNQLSRIEFDTPTNQSVSTPIVMNHTNVRYQSAPTTVMSKFGKPGPKIEEPEI